MKTKTHYQIRYWPSATAYSKSVGRRLVSDYRQAQRVIARLRKAGVDAFCVPMKVSI